MDYKVIDDYFPEWIVKSMSAYFENFPVSWSNSSREKYEDGGRFFGNMCISHEEWVIPEDLRIWFFQYFNGCVMNDLLKGQVTNVNRVLVNGQVKGQDGVNHKDIDDKEEVVKTATGGTGSQVGDIIVGTGLATAIAVDTALSDDEKKNATIINNTPNSIDFLTADEVFRLVSNNTTVRDQVAAGIYYKDIGSRKGLSVAQSDVEFNTQTDSVKTVYRTKVTTDIRKLVNKGYIKVGRDNQNVTVATEKASITT